MASCYRCGGYVYSGVRHRDCEPRYRRQRFSPCVVCGRMTRGVKHRLCQEGAGMADFHPCAYCGELTRGVYHKTCEPVHSEFGVFPDLPDVVQRRCSGCDEWFPFAGPDVDPAENFSPHGRSKSGRALYESRCRACFAEARRAREGRLAFRDPGYRSGVEVESDIQEAIAAGTKAGLSVAQLALRLGITKRTVSRWRARQAAEARAA